MKSRQHFSGDYFEALEPRVLFSGTGGADASIEVALSGTNIPPVPLYSQPFTSVAGGLTFENWTSDDLAMLIRADQEIVVRHEIGFWTIIVPDDAILFQNTMCYFGLGWYDFEPVVLRNESGTALFVMNPSENWYPENTFQVADFEAGGFATRRGGMAVARGEVAAGAAALDETVSLRLAWIGDLGGLWTTVRYRQPAPPIEYTDAVDAPPGEPIDVAPDSPPPATTAPAVTAPLPKDLFAVAESMTSAKLWAVFDAGSWGGIDDLDTLPLEPRTH